MGMRIISSSIAHRSSTVNTTLVVRNHAAGTAASREGRVEKKIILPLDYLKEWDYIHKESGAEENLENIGFHKKHNITTYDLSLPDALTHLH